MRVQEKREVPYLKHIICKGRGREEEEGQTRKLSGLETKRTNSRKISRLIPVAESEAKLFSSETRDYCE